MVVIVARRSGASAVVSRPAPQRTRAGAQLFPAVNPGHQAAGRSSRTLWRRFADDCDLVRLKIMLLVGLVVLAALLERAV